jgi:hypothetical protein
MLLFPLVGAKMSTLQQATMQWMMARLIASDQSLFDFHASLLQLLPGKLRKALVAEPLTFWL